jgi:hypothetical protein
MTNSYDFARSSDGLIERWGHYSPQLLTGSIVASIALGFNSQAPSGLYLLAALSLLGFVLMTWVQLRRHDRRLCESCAASIPLNAQEQGARYRRRFAVAHSGSNLKVVVPYLILLLGSNFLLTYSWGRWPWAVVQASMIYLILSHSTHRRLQPWCPWCSDGGGGSEFTADEPDSPRGRGRQLV